MILVDTIDLAPSAGKATPRDEAAVDALLPLAALDEEPSRFRAYAAPAGFPHASASRRPQ